MMNTSALSPKPVAIDPAMISRFADFLFGYCEGHVAIRLLRETGTAEAPPWSLYPPNDKLFSDLLCAQAQRAADDHRGLYVVPCTVSTPGNAKTENLFQTCVIPVDLDAGDIIAKRTHLEKHLGTASLAVESGGRTNGGQHKLHLYWKLKEAAAGPELSMIAAIRKRLAAAVDADSSFDRMTQPIRVPGSIHGKNSVLSRVRIVAETGKEYELADLLDIAQALPRLSNLPRKIAPREQAIAGHSITNLQSRRIRSEGRDGITRFEAMSSVIGHWIRLARLKKCSLEEALHAVHDHNTALIDPSWPIGQVEREFDALLKRDLAAHPDEWKQSRDDACADIDNAVAPACSEDALAGKFVDDHGLDWRHVALWGKWYHWNGGLWSPDEIGAVRNLVRRVCRAATPDLKVTDARRIASRKTIAAVEAIAATDPDVAVHPSDWDQSLYLLNTPSALLDLKTGELLAHDRDTMITHMAGADPGSGCPLWLRFLDDITGSDIELQAYLARVCGYCLTGDTSEQVFFFLYGAGANGKSVFVRTLSRVLGSYAATAPLESFMASRNSCHPTDLAGLRGKRLVSVSETESGRAWAESRIKTITGGDTIRARFMHRDFFEFTPTFKLMFAGNHRPQLTGVGEAMRRRLHLIPFTITVPPEARNAGLTSDLEKELNGILGWMLQGLADWHQVGLSPPSAVTDASETYFSDEDVVGQWIAECCIVSRQTTSLARDLFASWTSWAETAGLEKGSQKSLGEVLRSRGFEPARTTRGRFWKGIGLAFKQADAVE